MRIVAAVLLTLAIVAGILSLADRVSRKPMNFRTVSYDGETMEFAPFIILPGGELERYPRANEHWIVQRLKQKLTEENIPYRSVQANDTTIVVVLD